MMKKNLLLYTLVMMASALYINPAYSMKRSGGAGDNDMPSSKKQKIDDLSFFGSYQMTIARLVDPYKKRTLEGDDILTLELLDDASQHKITRQEANNSETLKNILADIGDESIEAIPIIGINSTVIDHLMAVLVEPSKTDLLLDTYWENDKFDEFIQFINAINYLNIKNAIKALKNEYFLTAGIPLADEINDTQKSIIRHIIQVIKDRNKDNIKRREDGDFISQQIQPLVNNALQDISFDEDPINLTIQGLKNVWGEDSRTFNSILRFLVYNQENLIMDHLDNFEKNIQAIIIKHEEQKDAGIEIDEELIVLDYWALHPNEKPNEQTTMIDIGAKSILGLRGITDIGKNIFDQFQNLKRLSLGNNQLKRLSDGIFDQLLNLQTLDLSDNKLTELPDGIFDQLLNLQTLDLSDNELTVLSDDTFDRLRNLKNLHLHSNELTELPDRIFDQLRNLQKIDLSGNELTELPDDIFDQVSKLKTLDLGINKLTKLPDRIFDQLKNLQKIVLSDYQIEFIPDDLFDNLTSLNKVKLFLSEDSEKINKLIDEFEERYSDKFKIKIAS